MGPIPTSRPIGQHIGALQVPSLWDPSTFLGEGFANGAVGDLDTGLLASQHPHFLPLRPELHKAHGPIRKHIRFEILHHRFSAAEGGDDLGYKPPRATRDNAHSLLP